MFVHDAQPKLFFKSHFQYNFLDYLWVPSRTSLKIKYYWRYGFADPRSPICSAVKLMTRNLLLKVSVRIVCNGVQMHALPMIEKFKENKIIASTDEVAHWNLHASFANLIWYWYLFEYEIIKQHSVLNAWHSCLKQHCFVAMICSQVWCFILWFLFDYFLALPWFHFAWQFAFGFSLFSVCHGNRPTPLTDDVNLAMLSAQPPDITTQTMHSSLRCNQVALPPHDEKIPISSTPTHPHHPDLTNGKVPHQLTVQFSPKKGGTITQLGCLGSSDISQYSLTNGSLHSHPHTHTLSPTKSHTYVPLVGPGQDKHIYATLNPPEPPQVQDPRYCQTRYHGDLEDNNGYIMEETDENYMLQAHSSEESIEPQSMYDSDPGRASMASVGGLPLQSDYIIASGHVGYRGGRLVLPESGLCVDNTLNITVSWWCIWGYYYVHKSFLLLCQ